MKTKPPVLFIILSVLGFLAFFADLIWGKWLPALFWLIVAIASLIAMYVKRKRSSVNSNTAPSPQNSQTPLPITDIENESLQPVSVKINLQKGETCYYEGISGWLEHKSITKSVNYRGPSYSFKITKGLRYRVGNIKLQKISEDKIVEVDRGTLFITNKRIIFMGAKKNITINYNHILSIVPYNDGFGIEKDAGKSPLFNCTNSETATRILARLFSENN